MKLIVAGIHTGIGKTICSAVLCEMLGADYWKPVQAGGLDQTDTDIVRSLVTKKIKFHPESYRLNTAASPHYAAGLENIEIKLERMTEPVTDRLIVETAGGIMSPFSETCLNIDLMKKLNHPVVVVSENYLGSINHTLMTLKILKDEKIKIAGIVFNGKKNNASEEFIELYSKVPVLFSIPYFDLMSKEAIADFAASASSMLQLSS